MSEEKKKTAREIIEGYDGPPVRIMEVCGTHTHEIFRLGIRKLLPKQVELISGPGCPVCVTQVGFIDEAVYLALECGVTICTLLKSSKKLTVWDACMTPGAISLIMKNGCRHLKIRALISHSIISGKGL